MSADPVLTLADLEGWSRDAPSLAVLGHPIRHSVSPPMHNAALAELARGEKHFADWRYLFASTSPRRSAARPGIDARAAIPRRQSHRPPQGDRLRPRGADR